MTDNPFPESDDNPSRDDVEDENEVTVILPSDMTDEITDDEASHTVPLDDKTDEVFVLLPDGDDSEIPMVETREITEDMDGAPQLSSAYEEATASSVGLRSDNPSYDVDDDYEVDSDDDATEAVE